MIVDELISILGFDFRGKGDLDRFNRGLDGAERKAKTLSATLGRLAIAAAGAVAAMGVGRALGGFLVDITKTNAQFETYEATLKTITGSAAEAEKSMAWIKQFGRTTPYEVGGVTEAFVRLKSYGIDPTNGSLRAIGDASSAMGKDIMSGVEAMADAVTGENERLKEFGITTQVQGNKITYNWRQNGVAMTKTVNKNATEIEAALVGIFGRFAGAMDEQSKTGAGMVSNLKDNWTDFLIGIGEAGYYEAAKRRLRGVMDVLEGWWRSGAIDRVAKSVSAFLVEGMDTAAHLGRQIYRVGEGFYYAADGVVELISRITGLSKSMSAAGLGLGLLASSAIGRRALMMIAGRIPMIAALFALDDILSGLNGENSIITSTEEGRAALERLKQAFADARQAAVNFADTMGRLRQKIVEALHLDEDAFSSLNDLKERWTNLRTLISEKLKAQGVDDTLLQKYFDWIEEKVTSFAANLRLLVTDPMLLVTTRLGDYFKAVSDAFNWFSEKIENFGTIIEKLMALIQPLLDAMGRISSGVNGIFGGGIESPSGGGTGSQMDLLRPGPPGSSSGKGGRVVPSVDNLTNKGDYDPQSQADQIRRVAAAIGADEEDVATLVRYETAGSMNPNKRGGAGNNYIGPIQFGPTERKQYGYKQGDTLENQYDAVIRYFKDRGYKPGMSGEQLYATVNTGSPYTGHRSDAGNGGRPGSANWKWQNDMGAHRTAARNYLAANPAKPKAPAGGRVGAAFDVTSGADAGGKLGAAMAARTAGAAGPITVHSNVTQNVKQATDAPGQAAKATSQAVGKAAVPPAARIEAEPAF